MHPACPSTSGDCSLPTDTHQPTALGMRWAYTQLLPGHRCKEVKSSLRPPPLLSSWDLHTFPLTQHRGGDCRVHTSPWAALVQPLSRGLHGVPLRWGLGFVLGHRALLLCPQGRGGSCWLCAKGSMGVLTERATVGQVRAKPGEGTAANPDPAPSPRASRTNSGAVGAQHLPAWPVTLGLVLEPPRGCGAWVFIQVP